MCWLALTATLLLTIGLMGGRGQTSPGTPGTTQAPSSQVQPLASPTPSSKLLVMIDPAHGGSESGAVLSPALLEKDVTLAIALRLRADLNTRGIPAEIVRDADVNLSTDDRAAKANSERPLLFICLHATSQTGGMRIYTAMLGEAQNNNGLFVDWDTAQSAALASSRSAQQQMVAVIQKSGIPVRALQAPLRPLNNVTTAALGIELAPTTADVSQLVSPVYQQNTSGALANGVAQALSALATNPGAAQ